MSFPGSIYSPPGVYTKTLFENPVQPILAGLKLPVFIGTGSEILIQNDLEIIRGSSSAVDQRIVQEDVAGRSVVSISASNEVTLGNFDGVLDRVQVRNFPLVTGQGTGTTATNTSAVSVTINGSPIVILQMDGTNGILKLSTPPQVGDDVRVTYFFNREDTQVTDNLSDQVTAEAATIRGAVGETYVITTGVNDTLLFTVDDVTNVVVTLPASNPGVPWTASQIASFINSDVSATTMVALSYETNHGETSVLLTADRNILIGAGSANSTFGFTRGATSGRNATFYTFQGPLVDGTNGGITTTDPSDVVIKVDGVQVIPTSVDGATRAVTLPFAPEVGAVVSAQYYFNTWQGTFDYLAHTEITQVLRAGATPDRSDFITQADFILKNDRILWGTASTVGSGVHTQGTEFFDNTQITATLVDVKQFLGEAAPVTDTTTTPVSTSTTEFSLPLVPTSGNGRNTPLGSSLFQSVANNRIDLPTNRPDLVTAYWGFGLQDAINRGAVTVLKVESSTATITLAEPVPVGAQVFASFYYNTLIDQEYTLTVGVPGAAGVGTYSILDENGVGRLTPSFGVKSAGLSGITIQFPSGSERSPDVRFEPPFTTTDFQEPVVEDVTITFSAKDSTLAKFTVGGSDPYLMITGASDNIDLEVDGSALAGGFIDLSAVNAITGLGFHASYVGGEVVYDAASGQTTYTVDNTNREVNLTLDGVLVAAVANSSASGTVANYITAINRAAVGEIGTLAGGGPSAATLPAGFSDVVDYYVGWTIVLTNDSPAGTQGLTKTITAYDGAGALTVDTAWAVAPTVATTYALFNSATRPKYIGATRFTSAVVITAGEYNALTFHYTGDVNGVSGNLTATLAPGTYTSATALAVAIQAAVNTALGGLAASFDGIAISVTANASAQIVFTLTKTGLDLAGFLEFIDGASTAVDFAVLAGLSTDASTGGGQAKLVDGPVARRFTIAGDNTSALLNDRVILRNRLVPGSGSMDAQHCIDQSQLTVEGSSGATGSGLTINGTGEAGLRAAVLSATLLGIVGFADGQVSGAGNVTDGQAAATFYASGGTQAQNNVFKFTFDGTPITVEFTDISGVAIPSGGSADVAVGPASFSNSIINQIASAMATAGFGASAATVIAAGLIIQEGAGFRLRSSDYKSSSNITIGSANANSVLGFVDGASVSRDLVSTKELSSALMAHAGATVASVLMTTWTTGSATASYFAGEALANVVVDGANAEYLFLQSLGNAGLGTVSSVVFGNAASDSVLLPGVGLGVQVGDGAVGELGISGFYVTSSDPVDGSGSVNDSLLNSGTGQDGTVGATYRDAVTGLSFTVLEREGGVNYPDGETFTFTVRDATTTDSNTPIRSIPGVELLVTNTQGIGAADTAIVATYERGGNEPSVGDSYFISYEYRKQDFSTRTFTKFATIEAEYGKNGPENPVTLASFLAILNGAVLIGVKQVEKDIDENNDGIADSASSTAFVSAVDGLEGPLPGGVLLNILVPLNVPSSSTVDFFAYIARHADIQSTMRHRSERTVITGFPAGTTERSAGDTAAAISRSRLRVVYPDVATLSLTQADGTENEFLVDGTLLASALSGAIVAPSVDVATPWTGRKLFGFNQLAKTLDAVAQNQLAVRGVTVLTDIPNAIKVRQGFATDMSNILTKTPTVIQIADEVQQQSRITLDRFIGIKFLPGVLSQIEGQLSTTLKLLVHAEILTAYTGVRALTADNDPTVAQVEAFYQPVFPLLYIVASFHLRSSL